MHTKKRCPKKKRKQTPLLSTKAEVDGQIRVLITPLDVPRAAVSALWANDRRARRRRDDLEPVVPKGGRRWSPGSSRDRRSRPRRGSSRARSPTRRSARLVYWKDEGETRETYVAAVDVAVAGQLDGDAAAADGLHVLAAVGPDGDAGALAVAVDVRDHDVVAAVVVDCCGAGGGEGGAGCEKRGEHGDGVHSEDDG